MTACLGHRTSLCTPEVSGHPAVFFRLTHPFSRALFPPPPSTFHTSSLGVPTCHFVHFHPSSARLSGLRHCPGHADGLGISLSNQSVSATRAASRAPAASPAAPRTTPRSPSVQLGRLRAREAAARLRRAPQAAAPAGSPATPDAQRRPPPPSLPPAPHGPGVSGFPRSRPPNAPASALARANAVPGSGLAAPTRRLPALSPRRGTWAAGGAAPGAGFTVASPHGALPPA